MDKEPEYVKSMSEARTKDPEKYDEKKKMYDASVKKETEDKDYSPINALKKMGKKVLGMKKGGVTRADGCCVKGKTKGRMV